MPLRRERSERRGVGRRGASLSEVHLLGSVDYLVVEFPQDGTTFTEALVDELSTLHSAGLIHLLDAVVLQKAFDGSVDTFEIDDIHTDALRAQGVALTGLLSREDLDRLSVTMVPGTVAGVVVWQRPWVEQFAWDALRAGDRVIAAGGLSATELVGPSRQEPDEQPT